MNQKSEIWGMISDLNLGIAGVLPHEPEQLPEHLGGEDARVVVVEVLEGILENSNLSVRTHAIQNTLRLSSRQTWV